MKLSDVKGEHTLDVIADVIDPLCNIAEDDVACAMFKPEKLPEGMSASKFLLSRARKSLPVLLKGHKRDIVAILAAIEGVSPDEYSASMNLAKLTSDTVELLTDEAFAELFISAQSGGNTSGSAQENTVDLLA